MFHPKISLKMVSYIPSLGLDVKLIYHGSEAVHQIPMYEQNGSIGTDCDLAFT